MVKQENAIAFANEKISHVMTFLDVDEVNKQKVTSFLLLYILSESLYKIVLQKYCEHKDGPLTESQKRNLKVRYDQMKAVFKWLGIEADSEKLKNIFSSENNSIKSLRDKLVHRLNIDTVKTVINNYNEIESLLNYFLSLFKEN